jgi:hypothetical protein
VVAAVIEQPLPIKVSEIIQLIQETAKKMFGKGFGINTLYNQKYVPEWRILVETAQSHIQQALSHILPEPETTKKSGLNPESEKALSHFTSMKVGGLVKIAAIDFLLAVERGIDSVTNLLTDRSKNLEFETGCSIETDKFISFTNGHMTPGAAPAAISKPNQSFSALDWPASPPATGDAVDRASWGLLQDTCKNLQDSPQSHTGKSFHLEDFDPPSMEPTYLEAIEEPDEDDDWPVIGGYLRRIQAWYGGKNIPELIARVVGFSGTSWHLECDEGHHWQCPIDMIGETWVIYYPSQ